MAVVVSVDDRDTVGGRLFRGGGGERRRTLRDSEENHDQGPVVTNPNRPVHGVLCRHGAGGGGSMVRQRTGRGWKIFEPGGVAALCSDGVMMSRTAASIAFAVFLCSAWPAVALTPGGGIAAGVRGGDPWSLVAAAAREPGLDDDAEFFVAWTVRLDGSADPALFDAVVEAGGSPWLRADFAVAAPLADHLGDLESELRELVELARAAPDGAVVQAVWRAAGASTRDRAFLLKRAAVAVTGAAPGARFAVGPLTADPASLRGLYSEGVAAYLDLVALAPGSGVAAAVEVMRELAPGTPLALDALQWPDEGSESVVRLAEAATGGFAVVLFEVPPSLEIDLSPLKVAANELSGSVVPDPFSAPTGGAQAWSFVREDLGLRVVVRSPPLAPRLRLSFADPGLGSPDRVDLASGAVGPLLAVRRGVDGLEIMVDDPGPVLLLRLERVPLEAEEGFGQAIDVAGDRRMPVDEILRRLQAVEDDQARRLRHFEARRAIHFRLQAVQGAVDATYSGDFFFRQGGGYDWVWSDFSIDGVKWRSRRLPNLPLIQPEKVASLPTEIRLRKDYDYSLRGTGDVDGRECWVVDFEPSAPVAGEDLYRGTVWIDREVFARVRMRVVQVGLDGTVLSNEEVYDYDPLDAAGRPTSWPDAAYVLPLRTFGQQNLSVLSLTLPVEVDTVITGVTINGDAFDRNLEAALASEATMVRDTDDGLRYLRKNRDGDRFVEAKLDTDRLFVLGGVLWDDSVDFPIPLAGVNYLDLDFGNRGSQLNVFFAGALLNASYADPRLLGSRWNGGATVGGRFFEATDRLYRDGEDVPTEDVASRTASASVYAGRPLAEFLTLDLVYRLRFLNYDRADDTAEEFVIPQDTLVNSFTAGLQYNRGGYRLSLSAEPSHRTDWQPWGLPGNREYDPNQASYLRWQASLVKTWWLPKFRQISLALEHLDGSDLDRFSGYDFGLFGDSSVAGYPSGLVRAERAEGIHLSAGVNYFDRFRVEIEGDAVWATNRTTGLDNELLAGIGVGGTVTLPWQLILNFEVGYALVGPGSGGVAVRAVFLRLFPGQ